MAVVRRRLRGGRFDVSLALSLAAVAFALPLLLPTTGLVERVLVVLADGSVVGLACVLVLDLAGVVAVVDFVGRAVANFAGVATVVVLAVLDLAGVLVNLVALDLGGVVVAVDFAGAGMPAVVDLVVVGVTGVAAFEVLDVVAIALTALLFATTEDGRTKGEATGEAEAVAVLLGTIVRVEVVTTGDEGNEGTFCAGVAKLVLARAAREGNGVFGRAMSACNAC